MDVHVTALARGCTFLGSGGGGSTRLLELYLSAHGVDRVDLRQWQFGDDLAALVLVGSVDVFAEMLPGGAEAGSALRALERWTDRTFTGVVPFQVGGLSTLVAVHCALSEGLDLVDADLVGRATERLGQGSLYTPTGGVSVGFSGAMGEVGALSGRNMAELEELVRSMVQTAGGWLVLALAPTKSPVKAEELIQGTLNGAAHLGALVDWADCPASMNWFPQVADKLRTDLGITALATGRIRYHNRYITAHGAEVESYQLVDSNSGCSVRVEATSEYLIAVVDGRVRARTPDIIQVADRKTLRPIAVQDLRVGNEVIILTRAAATWWSEHPEAARRISPRSYGLEDGYKDLEEKWRA